MCDPWWATFECSWTWTTTRSWCHFGVHISSGSMSRVPFLFVTRLIESLSTSSIRSFHLQRRLRARMTWWCRQSRWGGCRWCVLPQEGWRLQQTQHSWWSWDLGCVRRIGGVRERRSCQEGKGHRAGCRPWAGRPVELWTGGGHGWDDSQSRIQVKRSSASTDWGRLNWGNSWCVPVSYCLYCSFLRGLVLADCIMKEIVMFLTWHL